MARKSRKTEVITPILEKKSAIYVRLSQEDRLKKGDSLENQKEIALQHLMSIPELGMPLIYEDNGFTGRNADRPAFQKMLEDIEKGLIECVITKDLSRLGRNALDTGFFIERFFPLHKVRYISVNDQYDSQGNSSDLLVAVKNMLNESHSIELGKKVAAVKKQIIKDGGYMGARPPFGYQRSQENRQSLVIDPTSSPIVLEIFDLIASGSKITQVARLLNERGELSPSDYHRQRNGTEITDEDRCYWSRAGVTKILNSQVYLGNMLQGKTLNINRVPVKKPKEEYVLVENTHEPLISVELFEKVQKQLAKGRVVQEKKAGIPNLIGKILYCGGCGKLMRRKVYKKLDGYSIHYRCMTNYEVHSSACEFFGTLVIQHETLLPLLRELVEKQAELILGKKLSLMMMEKEILENKQQQEKEISRLKKEITKGQKSIKVLYENFVSNVVSKDDYHDMKSRMETELVEQKTMLNQALERATAFSKECAKIEALSSEIPSNSLEITEELICKLVERIVVHETGKIDVIFQYHFPLIDEVLSDG